MMFWFKKKKVVLDCFTPHRHVYDLYPIEPAIKFFPQEVKAMSNHYTTVDETTRITLTHSTVRKCNGLIDLYKTGAVIPFWTDFISEPKNAARGETSIGVINLPFGYNTHSRSQYPGMFMDYIHVKFDSPWRFRETTGVKFTWNPATWNIYSYHRNFIVLPAVVSYKYQNTTNINIMIDRNSENFTLTGGTPMVHITPLTDCEVVYKNHLVAPQEYETIGIPDSYPMLRPGRYNRYVKESEARQSKCPFGFGK